MSDSTETVPAGTRARYLPLHDKDALGGEIRIVGPIDKDGGADMMNEQGSVMDHRDAAALASDVFWRAFEPIPEEPETPAGSPVTFLSLSEVHDLRKHLGHLMDLYNNGNLYVADHVLFDTNGEPIGKVTFRNNDYVFEYDYIEANHRDEH